MTGRPLAVEVGHMLDAIDRVLTAGSPENDVRLLLESHLLARRELRRMLAEMETLPFVARTWNDVPRGHGHAYRIVAGCAGAKVYHDICPRRSATRGRVREAIRSRLAGRRSRLGTRALDVARRRLAGDGSVSRPELPPEAGDERFMLFDDEAILASWWMPTSPEDMRDPIGARDCEETAVSATGADGISAKTADALESGLVSAFVAAEFGSYAVATQKTP